MGYTVRSDGLRTQVVEHQKELDGTFSDVKVSYDYDATGRLTQEFRDVAVAGAFSATPLTPDSPGDFADAYAFDLSGNRLGKNHDAPGSYDRSNGLPGIRSGALLSVVSAHPLLPS